MLSWSCPARSDAGCGEAPREIATQNRLPNHLPRCAIRRADSPRKGGRLLLIVGISSGIAARLRSVSRGEIKTNNENPSYGILNAGEGFFAL